MRTHFVWLLAIITFSHNSFGWSQACGELEVEKLQPAKQQEEYGRLYTELETEFVNWQELSQSSIDKSRECLENDSAHEDCRERLNYFFAIFPQELQSYRKNLALSRWDTQFFRRAILNNIDEQVPFNWQLKFTGTFFRGHQPMQPIEIGSDEFLKIKEEFDRKIEVDFKQTITDLANHPPPNILPETIDQQMKILESRNLLEILKNPLKNNLAKKVTKGFEARVFALNKNRLVNQLVSNPLLAVHASKQVSQESLLVALKIMEENLNEEMQDIRKKLDKIKTRSDNIDTQIFSRNFYPFIEFPSISDAVFLRDPSLCNIAKIVEKSKSKKDMFMFAGFLTAMAIPIVFTLPVWATVGAVGGGAALQGYILYESNKEITEVARKSFLSPDESLNLEDVKDVMQSSSELKTNVYITPIFLLPSLKILNIKNIFKFLGNKG